MDLGSLSARYSGADFSAFQRAAANPGYSPKPARPRANTSSRPDPIHELRFDQPVESRLSTHLQNGGGVVFSVPLEKKPPNLYALTHSMLKELKHAPEQRVKMQASETSKHKSVDIVLHEQHAPEQAHSYKLNLDNHGSECRLNLLMPSVACTAQILRLVEAALNTTGEAKVVMHLRERGKRAGRIPLTLVRENQAEQQSPLLKAEADSPDAPPLAAASPAVFPEAQTTVEPANEMPPVARTAVQPASAGEEYEFVNAPSHEEYALAQQAVARRLRGFWPFS